MSEATFAAIAATPIELAAPALSWDGVWIVIPAYNEGRTIRALAEAALAICPRVVVVDDGSLDATAAQLEGLPLTVLRHPANLGKAASLRTAFRFALQQAARCVVTLDGDGQHDPTDAPALLAAWQERPDCIVLGARLRDKASFPRLRYIANRIAAFWISLAAGHAIADSQTGFRVYSSEVMALALGESVRSHRFAFESEVLIEAARRGHPTCAVVIAARYPMAARSSHYRALADSAKIGVVVAGRLLRSSRHRPAQIAAAAPAQRRARLSE